MPRRRQSSIGGKEDDAPASKVEYSPEEVDNLISTLQRTQLTAFRELFDSVRQPATPSIDLRPTGNFSRCKGNEVLKRRRGINDTFKKYIKRLKDEKRSGTGAKPIKEYHLYKQLLFLKKNYKIRQQIALMKRKCKHHLGKRIEQYLKNLQGITNSSREKEFQDDIINILKEPENRHLSFFKGILPSLEKLDDNKTLIFQSRVLQTLTDLFQTAHQGYPPSYFYQPSNYQSGYQTQHFANQTPQIHRHLSHEQSSNAREDQINSPSDNYSTYSAMSTEEEFDFT